MYGKVAIAAAGLMAAANARPHKYNPMTSAGTTTSVLSAPTVPLSDIVHSTVPDEAATIATLTATTNLLHPGIPTPGTTTSAVTIATPAFSDVVHSGSPDSLTSALSTATTWPASAYTGVATGSGAASTGSAGSSFANGFPNVSPAQVDQIELQAQGTLSNKPPPPPFHDDTLNAVAFIAFNELFEVKFFSELVHKISSNAPNFTAADIAPADRDVVLANLKVVVAQEELHALNAEAILKGNKRAPIAPCTYKFPALDFKSAIQTASLFTDMVLGTLPDIQTIGAVNGDFGLVGAVGSVVGQEGEQNGFYRSLLGKTPSELPFLTGAARNFAFNAILQNFVDKCPSETLDALEKPAAGIPLNQTGTLKVLGNALDLSLEDTTLAFSAIPVEASQIQSYYSKYKSTMNYITYVNQQNLPVSYPIDQASISLANGEIKFQAPFNAKKDFLNGFTIAAITETGNFTDADSVASAMSFGPGLIEVNFSQ